MELSFKPGSKIILFIYSGICFSFGLSKSDEVKTTYFGAKVAISMERVFVR